MKDLLERIEKARFTTTDEVFTRRKEIREIVQSFDLDTLEVYKWYFFFQLCLLKNPLKELLWTYIAKQNLTSKEEIDLCNEYRLYKERCMRIMQYQKDKREENENKNVIVKKETIRITCVEDLFKIWLNYYSNVIL